MSSSRSARVQHHPFHLSRSEQTSAQYAQKEQNGQWSCKLCHAVFGNTLRLMTHILTSCDQPLSTFSNRSAMHICMVLDESGSREMFETYLRIASEDADDEGSGHGSDMDTEVTDDMDSGEYDSQATISEEDNEPVKRKQAGADADGVWRVEQGEGDEEEEVGYVGYEGEDGADPMDDQPTLAAQGKRVRPPKNQEFPAMPPHSLSADKKREWTFRRNRAAEIRALVNANTDPNTEVTDKAAALAVWNSSSTHRRTHHPNSSYSKPYKNYDVLTDRESRDRINLRRLAEEARQR